MPTKFFGKGVSRKWNQGKKKKVKINETAKNKNSIAIKISLKKWTSNQIGLEIRIPLKIFCIFLFCIFFFFEDSKKKNLRKI